MGSGQATFPSRLRVSRGWFPLAPSAPARAARDTGLFWTRVLLALAGSTALAPCSFPAPLTFLAVQDVGPQPRVAGARPRVPKPVPGAGVSIPLAVARRATGLSCTPWAARFGVQPGAPSSSGSPKPQDFGAGRASRGSSKLSNLQPGACREQPGRAWAPPDLGGLWAAPHPKRGAGCCGWKHSGPS